MIVKYREFNVVPAGIHYISDWTPHIDVSAKRALHAIVYLPTLLRTRNLQDVGSGKCLFFVTK